MIEFLKYQNFKLRGVADWDWCLVMCTLHFELVLFKPNKNGIIFALKLHICLLSFYVENFICSV